jgi:hypothetical protein
LWHRIEERTNELMNELDIYHVTNILRSFTHALNDRMWGKDKTYTNLEPIVLKNINNISERDLSHIMYAYSIRNAGNPDIYKAFETKLATFNMSNDYPTLYNVVFYMLFRENNNE